MKKKFKLRVLFFIGVIALYSSSMFAQSGPMYIVNNSSCYMFVEYGEAHDCTTGTSCFSGANPNCIKPGSWVQINPCGGPSYEWAIGALSAADQNCRPCGPLMEVQRFVPCYSSANVVNFPSCDPTCPGTTAQWVAPNVIEIN
jgi:hypothetical protein